MKEYVNNLKKCSGKLRIVTSPLNFIRERFLS